MRDVLRQLAPVSIVTVGVWNAEVLILDLNTMIVPAEGMVKTEENVLRGSDVKMLLASPEAEEGAGSGYRITGKAWFYESGPHYELVRTMFRRARAAMVSNVDNVEQLI